MRNQPKKRTARGSVCCFPVVLAGLSLASLAAAAWSLWPRPDGEPCAWRIPAAALLAVVGLAQARIAWASWRTGSAAMLRLERLPLFWRYQLCGPVACYLLALMQGPGRDALFLFLPALAVWQTLGLAPLVLPPATRLAWQSRFAARPLCATGWCAFGILALCVAVELAVQVCSVAAGGRMSGAYVAHCCALAPGLDLRGRQVNERGYWDEHHGQPRGLLTVAAIGDHMLLAGTPEANHLSQAERRVPGVTIYNFGRPLVGPREYEAQLHDDSIACQADLVLAYISIGDDICDAISAPSLLNFDWRGLAAFQWGFRSFTQPGGSGPGGSRPGGNAPGGNGAAEAFLLASLDRESFLDRAVGRMTVCRTPISPELEECWNETFEHLDGIHRFCRRHESALALVLVPGEFQVSPTLCESLRRHAGYEPQQIDLDLPQRRLNDYAARRDVPVLDLLPYLRASHESPYERNDLSWNDRGNAVAAEALAQFLQRRFGPQIAANSQAAR